METIEKIKEWFKSTLFIPSSPDKVKPTGFKIFKDKEEGYRYFAWVSNNFKDREEEIIVDSAHREFARYLDKHPEEAPELWTWHTFGTARKNRVDWWDYANGFFMYSGILTEEEAKQFGNTEEIGMSHGFYGIKIGKFIVKYRTFEISELPRENAANPFTGMNINKMMEENSMFTDKRREYLVNRLGEEAVAELESNTKTMEEILNGNGIERKELEEKYEQFILEYTDEKAKETVESLYEEIVKALNIEELHEVLQSLAKEISSLPQIVKRLEAVEASTKALQSSYDKRISNVFDNVAPYSWSSVTKEEEETEVTEEELSDEEIQEVKNLKKESWVKNMSPLREG